VVSIQNCFPRPRPAAFHIGFYGRAHFGGGRHRAARLAACGLGLLLGRARTAQVRDVLRPDELAEDRAVAWSGGSEPESEINPSAIAATRERGMDISGEFPKPWTDEIERRVRALLDDLGVPARP
jgi:hypothetical protein